MKKIALFIICLLTVSIGFSQKKEDMRHNKETNLIEATYYHDNGQVSQQGTFDLKGKLHGEWVSYDETGDMVAKGTYRFGKRTGTWLFWDKDLVKEVQFDETGIVSVVNKDPDSKLVIKH